MNNFTKLITIVFFLLLTSSCSVFLASDPDDDPQGIFDAIWNDFDETYALFDIKGIDWNLVYKTHAPKISSGMGERELFETCSEMLGELNDAHVSLMSSFAEFNSGGRFDTSNMEPFSLDLVKKDYLIDCASAGEDMFTYGKFKSKPKTGYIYISGFANGENTGGSQDWIKAIDGIVQSLSDTDSLVIDIRGNRGGLPANLNNIAARFTAKEKDYADVRTKNGPDRNDFSSPVYYTIKPDGTRYTKPIVLLTNAQTISGGEWFTLALLSQDHVTHAGSGTCGAFSLSLERFLVNGWAYTVSVQIVRDMKGNCYEGSGVMPETEIKNTDAEIASGKDRQLEYARDFF